jgi:hypothetical protein
MFLITRTSSQPDWSDVSNHNLNESSIMTTNPISTGEGKLLSSGNDDTGNLQGTIELELAGDWSGERLEVNATAKIDYQDGSPCYRLNVGGLRGDLQYQPTANRGSPRYLGVLGRYREIFVQGWEREANGQWPRHIYLTLIAGGNTGPAKAVEPIITV